MWVEYWHEAADYLDENSDRLSDLYFAMESLTDGVPAEAEQVRETK